MESLLASNSNGKSVDFILVENATALTSDQTEIVTVDHKVSSENFDKYAAQVSGVITISTPQQSTAEFGHTAVPGTAKLATTGNTATNIAIASSTADQYNGQIVRTFKTEGATLADAQPLTGSSSPHGPKGYEDFVITGTDNAGNLTVAGATAGAYNFAQVLPAVKLLSDGARDPGHLRAIAVVERSR